MYFYNEFYCILVIKFRHQTRLSWFNLIKNIYKFVFRWSGPQDSAKHSPENMLECEEAQREPEKGKQPNDPLSPHYPGRRSETVSTLPLLNACTTQESAEFHSIRTPSCYTSPSPWSFSWMNQIHPNLTLTIKVLISDWSELICKMINSMCHIKFACMYNLLASWHPSAF